MTSLMIVPTSQLSWVAVLLIQDVSGSVRPLDSDTLLGVFRNSLQSLQ